MENRVLRYFVEMANEKNMTRAAEKLHVTQPTMSRQLKELEEELGVKLFHRTNYAIRLTDEGEIFLRRAKDILNLVDKTKAEFSGGTDPARYALNIGCPETDSIKYVARAVQTLRRSGIPLVCHVHSGNAEDVLERLNKGLDDFSLVLDYVDTTRYHRIPLSAFETWGVIMKKDHPLAAKKRLTTDDLLTESLIISRQAAEQIFPVWFGENAERLQIAASFNLAFNGALFVREGIGIMITLDKLVHTGAYSDLVFRPMTGVADAQLKLVWKKDQPQNQAARLLIDAIRAELGAGKDGTADESQ